MRLIDADDLWSEIMALPHNGDMISSEEVEQEIRDAHTVDAVEVVRCRDCKHRAIGDDVCIHPNRICDGYIEVRDDDFCSYGERKADVEDT